LYLQFNTKIFHDHGKSPYRHSPYCSGLHKTFTTLEYGQHPHQKASTIPSSVKSAPLHLQSLSKRMDTSFKTTLHSNPGCVSHRFRFSTPVTRHPALPCPTLRCPALPCPALPTIREYILYLYRNMIWYCMIKYDAGSNTFNFAIP